LKSVDGFQAYLKLLVSKLLYLHSNYYMLGYQQLKVMKVEKLFFIYPVQLQLIIEFKAYEGFNTYYDISNVFIYFIVTT